MSTPVDASNVPLGTIVTVSSIGRGIVRFNGTTSFKPGRWIGVELDEAKGKNDGSVGGERYFTCSKGIGLYGVFVRSSQIKSIGGNERDVKKVVLARPSMGHQRTSSIGSAASRSASPAKIISSGSKLGPSSSSSPSPTKLSPTPSSSKRLSGLGHQPRRSLSLKQQQSPPTSPAPPPASSPAPRHPSSPLAAPEHVVDNQVQTASTVQTSSVPAPSQTVEAPAPAIVPALQAKVQILESRLAEAQSFLSLRPKLQSKLSQQQSEILSLTSDLAQANSSISQLKRELSEQSKRFDALEKVQENRVADAQEQVELAMLDKEVAEERAEMAEEKLETKVREAEERLRAELGAGNKAQDLERELKETKEKLGDIEIEVQVLRELQALQDEEDTGETTTTTKLVSLEIQNTRLREALFKLRDIHNEYKEGVEQRESKREIVLGDSHSLLEISQLKSVIENLEATLAETAQRLEEATGSNKVLETANEQLKGELDDALSAEEMLVALTERNLVLGEKIEEMRITIQDLEALKDLSDELEENHVETERALMGDIDTLQIQLQTSNSRIASLVETCSDYEGTIAQFRELVGGLSGELSHLRDSTATLESASSAALSQQAVTLAANMRLQSTQSRNQSMRVELEVKRMEVREATEEMDLLKKYLPDVWWKTENDQVPVPMPTQGDLGAASTSTEGTTAMSTGLIGDRDALRTYMYFQRIAWKADIINRIVGQTHGLPEALDDVVDGGGISEHLVGVCEMRGRLSGLSTLCKRFAAVLRRCDPEMWLRIGRLFAEIQPLEKRLDIHVDLLRRDEFRERECVSDVVRIHAQFNHLAEIYFGEYFSGHGHGHGSHDIGERQLGCVVLTDLDLDMFAASIGMMKSSVEGVLKEDEFAAEADFGGFNIETELYEPLRRLLERSRSAKTSSRKMVKRLEDLVSSVPSTHGSVADKTAPSADLTLTSYALKAHLLPQMEALSNVIGELVNFGISLAQQTLPYLADVRSSKTSFKLTAILGFAKQQAGQINIGELTFKPGTLWWEAVGDTIGQVIQEGTKLLGAVMDSENVVGFTGPSPWTPRSQTLKASLSINPVSEHKISSLTYELTSLHRTLKTREQSIQELNIKIQLLERRQEGFKKQGDVIKDLESELGRVKKQEKAYEEAMEQLQGELDMLEKENGKLKAGGGMAMNGGAVAGGGPSPGPVGKGVGGNGEAKLAGQQEGVAGGVMVMPGENSLDHAQLLDQYTALRGTLRFLRMENAYLKGHDLIKEIQALPDIHQPARTRTPPLDPSGFSDTSDEEDADEESANGSGEEDQENSKRSLKSQTSAENPIAVSHAPPLPLLREAKMLYRSVMEYSSSPKVVDLSELNERRLEASRKKGVGSLGLGSGLVQSGGEQRGDAGVLETGGEGIVINKFRTEKDANIVGAGVWMPRKKMPVQQVLERKMRGERLGERVRGLVERVERANVRNVASVGVKVT